MSRLLYVCAGSIYGLCMARKVICSMKKRYISDRDFLQTQIKTNEYMKHEIPNRACVHWKGDYITINKAGEQLDVINNKLKVCNGIVNK